MTDDDFVQETPRTNYAKKIGIPLAVTGVCGIVAHIILSGKIVKSPAPKNLKS